MSGSAAVDADGGVNKVRVKRQIRGIVKDLENILGDLKDVAKELKEVCVTARRRRRRMKLSCVRFDMMFMSIEASCKHDIYSTRAHHHQPPGFIHVSQNQRFDSL